MNINQSITKNEVADFAVVKIASSSLVFRSKKQSKRAAFFIP